MGFGAIRTKIISVGAYLKNGLFTTIENGQPTPKNKEPKRISLEET